MPKNNIESDDYSIYNSISPLRKINIHVAGSIVLHAIFYTKLKTQFEKNYECSNTSECSDSETEELNEFEDDLEYLRSLDPKDWKNQDHYAVLGIKKIRHNASEDVIKRAYKHKILKHHPDKRKAMGEEIRADDDYFTCITRAWEMLGNPIKRKSYDSVDPYFNDSLPDEKDVKNEFFETMKKAFDDNSRWSIKQPVPSIGDIDTPRDKVEKFYSFWYEFDSWREYSYLDEEDKESGQDRDMRKWIEKKNKQTRAKRKKEEMTRIRTLVDIAYNIDPRIKKFQQDDKDKKTAVKRAKQEAAKARQQEEERLAREIANKEREEREKREMEEKVRQDALKQERETLKKALKKERKVLRDICKSQNYFSENPTENIKHMESVEKFCEIFKLNELEEAINDLQLNGRESFINLIKKTENKIEAERRFGTNHSLDSRNCNLEKQVKTHLVPWSENDLQLLIKAVNLFPAGTSQRWEVVANFINQHANNSVTRDAKEVLAKAKDLQSTDFSKSSLKEQANKKAFDNFIAENKNKELIEERMPAVTERLDPITNGTTKTKNTTSTLITASSISSIHNNINNNINNNNTNNTLTSTSTSTTITGNGIPNEIKNQEQKPLPWTPAEQKLLEQALKTYSNIAGSERWDKIALCIPSRTKKDCMRRYKELVELVKAKKAATIPK